ncbi:MAG: amidase family protein [Alphaproteobacteria bacterium]|jgi:aspartyl-tRNA(Asn)/glutamyl-tRNA(Gln) amidotransferase subunit A|nr:amidase family protein [Alphaproteobacteria bacterium]MDP6566673.1 amidase family protein [Alphaproteobacteria bacterium]MDP6813033.1 amidase family protein [Alphaproteobacteria bacterium]
MSEQAWHEMTALDLGAAIGRSEIDPVDLADHFLGRIASEDASHQVYINATPERARAEAEAASARAKAGLRQGSLDGVPMSWKDLTDTAGVATTFGSAILRDRVPARDALLLRRATLAGMVCLGKTNLSEFAYSGLGINPVYGTPANAADGAVRRVPGGSSSGAAVSVGRGLAPAGIGSDTGGSVRIPAALNGVVGLKTTIGVLPLDGILPLSPSLDTIGPLTRDVADANAIFGVLNDSKPFDLTGAGLAGVRLLKPRDIAYDELDETVGAAVSAALDRLADAGAEIVEAAVPEFAEAFEVVARHGNIISAEAYALWGEEVDSRGDEMYWGVLSRFQLAKKLSAIDAETAHIRLHDIAQRYHARTAGFTAVVVPACPRVAPPIAGLEHDPAAYDEANLALTRNTRLGNILECCALTLPCQRPEELPVGLMLMQRGRSEGSLLRLAKAVEAALA